jgi:hypothetical protein
MRLKRPRRALRLETLEDRLAPATFTVTNTDDSGTGSLRQAITDANNTANTGGPDEIRFNIAGGGVHTIRPDIGLPQINDPVLIDGFTQPGSSPNSLAVGSNAVLLIEIHGADAGETSGLVINAPDTTVRGLVVNGFQMGQSSTTGRGIVALGSANTNIVIAGNYIGVDPSGTQAVPNENLGIFILTPVGARVGGADPADRNVISGNGIRGLFANARDLQIKGNYFGTNAAGTAAIPNGFEGAFVADNSGYQIGGPGPGEGNVFSGNGSSGLTLNGLNNSFVQGNKIGVGADGITPLGNGGDAGLFIIGLAATNLNNQIGGPATAANTIAFNTKTGISLLDINAAGNRFQRNSIFENGLLGIDLDNNGPTANDDGDADSGANSRQNRPVLVSAPILSGTVRVNGSLNSVANETYVIELFSVTTADAPGGEGRSFIGATEVITDANGNATFQVIVNVPEGTILSSTATRLSTNDTSEFSNNVTALTAQGGTVSGTAFEDRDGDGIRDANEPPLAGIVLFLDANDNGVPDGEPSAVSAPDGSYTLTSPVDGTFAVKALLAGGIQTAPLGTVALIAANTVNDLAVGVQLPPVRRYAVGSGSGGLGRVQVFDAADGLLVQDLVPYAGFSGGVSVALGDINGDGTPDLVTGTSTISSHVKVFDGLTGSEIRSFLAFDGFAGGVNVGSWDITGDGLADVIVGTATGSSHVKVFSGADGALSHSFLAFDGFSGGVSVAGGDLDGDGVEEIIVGTASGAAHVKVFRGSDLALLRSFFAFDGFTGGVTVGSGDVDGDGSSDIVAGTASGASHVAVFSGADLSVLASYLAFPGFAGGVRVGAVDRDADGLADVIAGAGAGAAPHGTITRASDLATLDSFFALLPGFSGLFVAGR